MAVHSQGAIEQPEQACPRTGLLLCFVHLQADFLLRPGM